MRLNGVFHSPTTVTSTLLPVSFRYLEPADNVVLYSYLLIVQVDRVVQKRFVELHRLEGFEAVLQGVVIDIYLLEGSLVLLPSLGCDGGNRLADLWGLPRHRPQVLVGGLRRAHKPGAEPHLLRIRELDQMSRGTEKNEWGGPQAFHLRRMARLSSIWLLASSLLPFMN